MAIEFNCPHCGAFYRLDDKFAGKMGKCKNAKCRQSILIPFRSTSATAQPVPPQKVDAETLAASAFHDEPPPKPELAAAPQKKVAVACHFCEHRFEADAAMAGKNTTCPECGKIIRVPKLVEDKPADWRTGASGRPSMAKAAEPVPAGAWDAERKGVSAQSLLKAGAVEEEEEDDEEPGSRRLRRIKQVLYGAALLGLVAFAVVYLMRTRREQKEEGLMEKAIAEIEDGADGTKKEDFRAAIHGYAGEYFVRAAQKRDHLEAAAKWFDKARDELQRMPENDSDRNGMLCELGSMLVVCGGTPAEIGEDRRLSWDKVHPMIRRCLEKIPADQGELRARSFRMLTRKLNEKGQGRLASRIARSCVLETDQPEVVGRVGIELFLLDKKDLARNILETELSPGESDTPAPALQPTPAALWLALNPEEKSIRGLPPLDLKSSQSLVRPIRLGYAEGWALRENWANARKAALMPGPEPDQIEALLDIGSAAAGKNNSAELGGIVDEIAAYFKNGRKVTNLDPWLLVRAVELSARVNKNEATSTFLNAIGDESIRAWAQLEVLRGRLAGQPRKKAEDSWVSAPPEPPDARLAPALAQAEFARHNAGAGEKVNVQALPKGTLRAFGYAGMALGQQDSR